MTTQRTQAMRRVTSLQNVLSSSTTPLRNPTSPPPIRVGGGVLMLRIIEIEDQNQQWLGVFDARRKRTYHANAGA